MILPELTVGVLDAPTVEALFDDLEQHAQVLDVITKGGPAQQANAANMPLRVAQTLLSAGGVRGVQIRYIWDGAEWRDTLLATTEGIRLVRMKREGEA